MPADELPKCPLCGVDLGSGYCEDTDRWHHVIHDCDADEDGGFMDLHIRRNTRAAVVEAVRRLCGEGEA